MRNVVFQAVRAGDLETLRAVLAGDPRLAAVRNDAGTSALLFARYCGRDEAAALLFETVRELDAFECAALGQVDRLAAWIDAGTPLDAVSADGLPMLSLAAYFGESCAAAELLRRGADPNIVAQNGSDARPLHAAVAAEDARTAHVLLDNGADPNARQHGGTTPLHTAAKHGNEQLVELLITHGANRRLTCDRGCTAADHARASGHAALAQRLEASANA